jgi:hypothetical protein
MADCREGRWAVADMRCNSNRSQGHFGKNGGRPSRRSDQGSPNRLRHTIEEVCDNVLYHIVGKTIRSVNVKGLQEARRSFAEELRYTAHVQSPAVVEAFATVPREHFAGPGPWRILSPRRTTDDGDPKHLCHDVLVAIDEMRRLNNGQPSLWACLYDQLGSGRGAD